MAKITTTLLLMLMCSCSSNYILTNGMPLSDAHNALKKSGASIVEDAFPLPWNNTQTSETGYHIYWNMADNTCIQLQVLVNNNVETVIGYRVNEKGKKYIDNATWAKGEEHKRIKSSESVNLSDYLPP